MKILVRPLLALAIACAIPSLACAEEVDYGRAIGKLCPGQVPPAIPAEAIAKNITGTVVARARIVEGFITEVTIESGPDIFREPVINAMKRYRCDPSAANGVVTRQFEFRPQGK